MVEYLRYRVWSKRAVNHKAVLKYICFALVPLLTLSVLLFEVVTPPGFIRDFFNHYLIIFWILFLLMLAYTTILVLCLDKAVSYPP